MRSDATSFVAAKRSFAYLVLVPLSWISEYLDIPYKPNEIANALTMAGLEVSAIKTETFTPDISEIVLKVEPTSNRGDCFSIIGICRELSAIFNTPLKKTNITIHNSQFTIHNSQLDTGVQIIIEASDLCFRYSGTIISNIKITESHPLIQRRLIACGMRPINSIVDITNYVMLETGQPLHAFDLDTLIDNKIIVRRPHPNEDIDTIDDFNRKLSSEMLIIADTRRPVAIAGVMGGKDTEVTEKTKNILLESAHFIPSSVRKTSKKLDLRTEASIRFERGVDPNGTLTAIEYTSQLIENYGLGQPSNTYIDNYPAIINPSNIKFNPKNIERLAGKNVKEDFVLNTFKNLHFQVEKKNNYWSVDVPTFRFDVKIEEDLIEEIIRIYGYNNIESSFPISNQQYGKISPELQFQNKVKEILIHLGLDEVFNFSFCSETDLQKTNKSLNAFLPIKISNPLSEETCYLRPSLLPGMLKTVVSNFFKGNKDLFLFEFGKIFFPPASEKESLLILITGCNWKGLTKEENKKSKADFFLLKGIVEGFLDQMNCAKYTITSSTNSLYNPHRAAAIYVDKVLISEFGEIHPQIYRNFELNTPIYIAEIFLDKFRKCITNIKQYKKFSHFPAIARDIAIVIDDEINSSEIETEIRNCGDELIENLEVFDIYKGDKIPKDKKSLAYSITFRHKEKTLKDTDINLIIDNTLTAIKEKLGGVLRDKCG